MELEDSCENGEEYLPFLSMKKMKTPSTGSYSSESNLQNDMRADAMVSEFSLSSQMAMLSKMLSQATMEQKENEKHATDRFIPLRKTSDQSSCSFSLMDAENEMPQRGQELTEEKMTLNEMYKCLLLDNPNKMLAFGQNPLKSQNILNTFENQKGKFQHNSKMINPSKLQKKYSNSDFRRISKTPFKVLDAPNLQDDFYLNLLEWSSQNILSVALESSLYFWNANNNRVLKFCDLNPETISSINWNQHGSQISIGTSKGTIEIWDVAKSTKINEYSGHSSRVSSVAWNGNILASGSRDRTINVRDIRESTNQIFNKYEGHTQEVCGLKWSFDGNLLASGGNDNKLFIWSNHSSLPISKFSNHCAAVKGIAWSPHNHGVLASGGGSADKTIKFWNTLDSTLLDSIDTGSQVCNLIFSKNTKEIVSTHGYSNNEIIIWKYPTLQKLTTLTGHTSRVLFLAMSPNGETIVTGAGDETLRFWSAFPEKAKKQNKSSALSMMELR